MEDIIRLAEGSAKTRLSLFVEEIDVKRAIDVYESSIKTIGVNPVTGEIDIDKAGGYTSKESSKEIQFARDLRIKIYESSGTWPTKISLVNACIEEGMNETDARNAVQKLWTELGNLNAY